VHARLPDATLRIVGCLPDGVRHPAVHVEGRLDKRDPAQRERLVRCYLRASCFCLPTLFDPFPNAIVEAAWAGLPSVAIDNGSRREVIIDGVTGVLANASEPDAVAAALIDVLESSERCQAMGRAARQHAELHFNWDRVVRRIGRVVTHGLSGTAVPSPV
jgi:glycosyltransferase involved in cell wall biosynthesis